VKTLAFNFRVDEKHFENAMAARQSCDFPERVFLNHKSKITGDCCVFKFLRRSVDGKHLMGFQSDTSVFNFLRRSVHGAPESKFGPFTFTLTFLQENSPLIEHQLHNDFGKKLSPLRAVLFRTQ